ncbi:oxygen-dependent protoporphyrinogen oxidase [Nakamurella sp. UYEF19]|uniref:protoporphyrinogen oxidase n=1 Tax=Nakamurella sp. UYEF19 TaxID=1756392 RepID=UPI00339185DD
MTGPVALRGDLARTVPVVVGGGIAGLVVAWELARAGRPPLLLESGPTVGGCIAAHLVGGLELDAGAESYATATTSVADLIDDLGLGDAIVSPNPVGAWVRYAGGSAPLPTAALLGIPAHPLAADVRRVLGLGGSLRAGLDRLLPAGSGAHSASLGALVGSRMGRRVVDRLVEPVAGGVYSTDPDELDVDAVQPRLRGALREAGSLAGAVQRLRGSGARPGSAVAGLRGGLYSLVVTLREQVEALGGTVLTGVDVAGVRPREDGWQVTTSVGDRLADTVVLAVPGPAAVSLLDSAGIPAPATSAATSDVLLVTLVVDHAGLDRHPRGTGILVSRHARGVSAKALTHATAKWAWLAERAGPSRHVLRLSYGRGTTVAEEAHPLDERDLTTLALADAGTLTGVRLDHSALADSALVRWSSALPRPEPGHRAEMDRLRTQVAARPGLHLAGSVVAGTGLAAVVSDARTVGRAVLSSGQGAQSR